ncbi:MAG: hypothetical protein K2Y37_02510 [Pirellulales bacterium]|nr:hypothetical protein [Pirellulales bacterium]
MAASVLHLTVTMFALSVPDLWIEAGNGAQRIRVDLEQRSSCLSLTSFDSNASVTRWQGPKHSFFLADVVRSSVYRTSVADDRLWAINFTKSLTSGLSRFDAELLLFSLADLPNLDDDRRATSVFRRATPFEPAEWNERVIDALVPKSGAEAILHPRPGYLAVWQLRPYEAALIHSDPRRLTPLGCVLCAVARDRAFVGIFLGGRIVFLEFTFKEPSGAEFRPPTVSTVPVFADQPPIKVLGPVIGPLVWRQVGAADTSIDTWSTACWIDDALHLVSDDGKYERFLIKDDKVVRAGQLIDLGAPAAICQGKSHLWVLTESENGPVAAQEITWHQQGEPAKTQRDLGRVTLDAAAVKVLAAERVGK